MARGIEGGKEGRRERDRGTRDGRREGQEGQGWNEGG